MVELYLLPVNSTGRPRIWPMREINNGIFSVTRAGCPWRLMLGDAPPSGAISRCSAAFWEEYPLEQAHHALVMADRERGGEGWEFPSKAGERRGVAAAKKITDAGVMVLSTPTDTVWCSSRIGRAFKSAMADGGCRGQRAARFRSLRTCSTIAVTRVVEATMIAVVIVGGNANEVGLAVQPRRGDVERFFAWIDGSRRLVRMTNRRWISPAPSCMPPLSCFPCDASRAHHDLRNSLLAGLPDGSTKANIAIDIKKGHHVGGEYYINDDLSPGISKSSQQYTPKVGFCQSNFF